MIGFDRCATAWIEIPLGTLFDSSIEVLLLLARTVVYVVFQQACVGVLPYV
jgi:hypothetical protein